MLYALIGTGLVGALSSALLLFLKARVETRLAASQGSLAEQLHTVDSWRAAAQGYSDRLRTLEAELVLVKGQRDEVLKQLERSGSPGSAGDLLRRTVAGSGSSGSST